MTEDAAAEAGVSSPVGFRWFRHAGGVNPCLPSTVSGRYLSFSEREDIALLRAKGVGVREIAHRLKRDPSTISRELRRNASTRTWRLDHHAWFSRLDAGRPVCLGLVHVVKLMMEADLPPSSVVTGMRRSATAHSTHLAPRPLPMNSTFVRPGRPNERLAALRVRRHLGEHLRRKPAGGRVRRGAAARAAPWRTASQPRSYPPRERAER
jgi:hypothetical protein